MISRIPRVAWQAHRKTVTRRCVLPARWSPPRGSFQPSSSPLWWQDEPKESFRTSQMCTRHSKLTTIGQRVKQLRKVKGSVDYSFCNYHALFCINYYCAWHRLWHKNLHNIVYIIWYCGYLLSCRTHPFSLYIFFRLSYKL